MGVTSIILTDSPVFNEIIKSTYTHTGEWQSWGLCQSSAYYILKSLFLLLSKLQIISFSTPSIRGDT